MNLRVPMDNITDQTFVVHWDKAIDLFSITFNVSWYRESRMIGTTTNVTKQAYTVMNLTANTSYSVTVVAINTCCGKGPASDVTVTTLPASSNTGKLCDYWRYNVAYGVILRLWSELSSLSNLCTVLHRSDY